MSPTREAPPRVSGAERARILRDLLRDADGCRILLTPEERETIAAAIDLYDCEPAIATRKNREMRSRKVSGS
jgi:hypothetical protein